MSTDDRLKDLRIRILRAANVTKEGHIASAFSILEILYALYGHVMSYRPLEPDWEDRDYLLLSKGHGAMALYAILGEMKFFDSELLNTYYQRDSILGGHPDRNKVPGVEISSGSLGHGLPIAVGLAMALKQQGKSNRVFVIVGDGELNEGSNWEALMIAGAKKLDNLFVVIDYNHSTDAALDLDPLHVKFSGFNIEIRTASGHNVKDIVKWLQPVTEYTASHYPQPKVIIAHTIKGKGIRAIEANPGMWHHRAPTDAELQQFTEELCANNS
jgi:transketolase